MLPIELKLKKIINYNCKRKETGLGPRNGTKSFALEVVSRERDLD